MKKLAAPKDRILVVFDKLKAKYPNATCALNFKNPFQLLAATILSAQCTDARVNLVTPPLFKKYPSPKEFAKAKIAELEQLIRTTGFFRNKARSIKNCAIVLIDKYNATVPKEMADLTTLPGVGRKTAGVIRAYAYGLSGIICDTHFLRVTFRLGLTKNKDPEKVEKDIASILPEDKWSTFSTLMTTHGRTICMARKPLCPTCPVLKLCPFGQENILKDTA